MQTSRSIRIEADVPNPDLELQAGLFAEAEIVVDPDAQALVVPAAGGQPVRRRAESVARRRRRGQPANGPHRPRRRRPRRNPRRPRRRRPWSSATPPKATTARWSPSTSRRPSNCRPRYPNSPIKRSSGGRELRVDECIATRSSLARTHDGSPLVQWLARVCVERPVFALMLIAAVVVAGAASYPQLGIDRFPNIDLPTIRVQTSYPGAASAEVESEVTQPLEDAVATVAGLDELRSISNDGVSMLMLTFRLDQNINVAAQDVRDAIAGVLNRLPPDIDPPVVQKQDLDASPIMSLAVSGPRDTRELYFLADRYVKSVDRIGPRRRPGDDRGRGRPGDAGQHRRRPAGRLPHVDHAGARRDRRAKRRSARRPRRCRLPRAEPAHARPRARRRATSTTWSWRRSTTCRCGSATWARRSTSRRNAARWPASTASRRSCCRCSGSRA